MLGCLLVIVVSMTWSGCSLFNRNANSVLPKADMAKLKKEVAKDPFPNAGEAGIAILSDS